MKGKLAWMNERERITTLGAPPFNIKSKNATEKRRLFAVLSLMPSIELVYCYSYSSSCVYILCCCCRKNFRSTIAVFFIHLKACVSLTDVSHIQFFFPSFSSYFSSLFLSFPLISECFFFLWLIMVNIINSFYCI